MVEGIQSKCLENSELVSGVSVWELTESDVEVANFGCRVPRNHQRTMSKFAVMAKIAEVEWH